MLCAAVAAGVCSTFGCPLGGVIFSIELTSTFYMVSNLWKAFFCATIALISYKIFHLSHYLSLYKKTDYE
jgi:chloride channel 2